MSTLTSCSHPTPKAAVPPSRQGLDSSSPSRRHTTGKLSGKILWTLAWLWCASFSPYHWRCLLPWTSQGSSTCMLIFRTAASLASEYSFHFASGTRTIVEGGRLGMEQDKAYLCCGLAGFKSLRTFCSVGLEGLKVVLCPLHVAYELVCCWYHFYIPL